MAYKQERQAFEQLKQNCTDEAKAAYTEAVGSLLGHYNTTIRENRSPVGGAVEIFTCGLFQSAGVNCAFHRQEDGLFLSSGEQLAVNGCFTGRRQINLINVMGGDEDNEREWIRATLFVVSGTGIIYGAPDMVNSKDLKQTRDALKLPAKILAEFATDPENVFEIDVPQKPGMTGDSKKISLESALKILEQMDSDVLLSQVINDLT